MTETGPVTAPATSPRRSGRWVWGALIVSLALNLLVAGTVGVAAWRFHHHGPGAHREGNVGIVGFAGMLPAARREAVWNATQEERSQVRPFRAEVREARQELHAALLAEPFDRGRFEKAQARVLEAEIKMRAAAQKLFASVAAQLTKDERAAFVARISRGDRPGQGHLWRNRHEAPPAAAPATPK